MDSCLTSIKCLKSFVFCLLYRVWRIVSCTNFHYLCVVSSFVVLSPLFLSCVYCPIYFVLCLLSHICCIVSTCLLSCVNCVLSIVPCPLFQLCCTLVFCSLSCFFCHVFFIFCQLSCPLFIVLFLLYVVHVLCP